MAARTGMSSLISQFRNLVADTGTVSFTDDRAQQILDNRRFDFYQQPLVVTAQEIEGTVQYFTYAVGYKFLEGTATVGAFRLYDSTGEEMGAGLTTYEPDFNRGVIVFDEDQRGSARYLDGRSYDLYGAVADGWREKAGMQSGSFDFRVEGRAYSRSQWFKHCFEMARNYESMAHPSQAVMERGDMC